MKKVLVANRGEIAVRIIHACHDLDIAAVAVYSDDDVGALHVRLADESMRIGPPPPVRSYLNIQALIEAAAETGADSIHPGYGFLAENAEFATACRNHGITFIGPTADVIPCMGDKVRARGLARQAGVPVIPGTLEAISRAEVLSAGEEIGYPVLVKAAAGGGGRGIRVAHSRHELLEATEVAEQEARMAFGDGSVYLERQLKHPRHIEVQVLADLHGNVVHLYERECSIQRRRQKILEEAPSLALLPETRKRMTDHAVRLCQSVGYTSAGTIEFLVDGQEHYFLEMNTRIQVEHPVTEVATTTDIVREQIRIAYGEPLSVRQEDVRLSGWALEFRINAEDPSNHFYPSPGRVTHLRTPGGPGVRVDSALYLGSLVQPYYDSLVAKLIVWDSTREQAILRARRALWEFEIGGIKTTLPLHRRVVYDDTFLTGDYHTGFIDHLLEPWS